MSEQKHDGLRGLHLVSADARATRNVMVRATAHLATARGLAPSRWRRVGRSPSAPVLVALSLLLAAACGGSSPHDERAHAEPTEAEAVDAREFEDSPQALEEGAPEAREPVVLGPTGGPIDPLVLRYECVHRAPWRRFSGPIVHVDLGSRRAWRRGVIDLGPMAEPRPGPGHGELTEAHSGHPITDEQASALSAGAGRVLARRTWREDVPRPDSGLCVLSIRPRGGDAVRYQRGEAGPEGPDALDRLIEALLALPVPEEEIATDP